MQCVASKAMIALYAPTSNGVEAATASEETPGPARENNTEQKRVENTQQENLPRA